MKKAPSEVTLWTVCVAMMMVYTLCFAVMVTQGCLVGFILWRGTMALDEYVFKKIGYTPEFATGWFA